MAKHKIATREEWQAARNELLAQEKELTRRGDQLAAERRDLPWVPIDKEYSFDTDDGPKTLPELFDGRSQLLVYHFMFGPAYTAGCPVCSSAADTFNGAVRPPERARRDVHLHLPGAAGQAPGLQAADGLELPVGLLLRHRLQLRPGDLAPGGGDARDRWPAACPRWSPSWPQECGTEPAAYLSEAPVMSAYALEDGTVYLTYSTTARGLEFMMGYYGFLDRAPLGRNEGDPPQLWVRRHDEYDSGYATGPVTGKEPGCGAPPTDGVAAVRAT